MVDSSLKVYICFIILVLLLIFSLRKKETYQNSRQNQNNQESDAILSFPYISSKKKIIIGGKNDIDNGDISVEGTTVATNLCIEDDDNNIENCIDQDKLKKIKNNPHHFENQICIDKSLCINESDAIFLQNIKRHLANKTYQMKHKMFNSKPGCNWGGQKYFCGNSTGVPDDYNIGCFNGKFEYVEQQSYPLWGGNRKIPGLTVN